jgi:hypothetical protein
MFATKGNSKTNTKTKGKEKTVAQKQLTQQHGVLFI